MAQGSGNVVTWRKIYEYPYIQVAHAFLDGIGCCGVARSHFARMQGTIAPDRALDTCAACSKWLRSHEQSVPRIKVAVERK